MINESELSQWHCYSQLWNTHQEQSALYLQSQLYWSQQARVGHKEQPPLDRTLGHPWVMQLSSLSRPSYTCRVHCGLLQAPLLCYLTNCIPRKIYWLSLIWQDFGSKSNTLFDSTSLLPIVTLSCLSTKESEGFCCGCVARFWSCGMALSGLSVCVWCFPLHTWPVSDLRFCVNLDRKGEERDGVGLLFLAPSRGTYKVSLPAASAVFWCQKLAWQEWHSRTPHHVARAQPVLCMLNWQLKSLATTSPRPLIRDSPLPWSLYPLPAGNPIVCGILEDCSDCNRGSFISAGPGGGTPRSPSSPLWAV